MHRTKMIADHLRSQARWRLDRADENDEGRNARSALALFDAAMYADGLDESDKIVVRLAVAGCFALGRFNPGREGVRTVRFWHYDTAGGGPAELLEAVVTAAERGLVPRPREHV